MTKNQGKSFARSPKKPSETENARIYSGRGIARISLIIAVMALILVLFLLPRVLSSSSTDSVIVAPTPSAAECAPGLSAYDLWLAIGNEGTIEDFLNSIVGEKGTDGYAGSDGFTGGNGASAYELWLAAGNQGTPQVFLESLVGASGISGTAGSPGADGAAGSPGLAGAAGISAYQLWLEQGNTGTESEFLTFLLGQQGPAGPEGQSSYELWRQQEGNQDKSEADFLISLIGAQGPAGEAGVCTVGETGPAGPAGGFGASGSWHDVTDQVFGNAGFKAMRFGVVDYEDGIKMVDGTKLTFDSPGTYNIQFSAQLSYPSGGADELVNIWLAKNGNSIPNSNTRVIVPGGNDGYVVAAWNFFITVEADDQVQLIWSASDKDVQILHEEDSGGSGFYQPGIPSIILTVNQVAE
jgi:hypothetical protein